MTSQGRDERENKLGSMGKAVAAYASPPCVSVEDRQTCFEGHATPNFDACGLVLASPLQISP